MNGSQRHGRHKERLRWLQAQADLLSRLPCATDDVTDEQSALLRETFVQMKKLGLYSRTTDRHSAQWGIRLLVSELRGKRMSGTTVTDRSKRYG